ncbi:MAG: rRNA maturation RNase YbeY [Nitrospirae bacterium]|nr:MAG: rRNA maturation RNase YbeY [Nitrospirota bacterium]
MSPRRTWCATGWFRRSSRPTSGTARSTLTVKPPNAQIDSVPVLLQNRQRAVAVDRAWLGRTAGAVLAAARAEAAELSLVLVSDRRMRALNQRYRNKDRSTDVLAFPMHAERGQIYFSPRKINLSPVLLGDVVISMPTAKRQAAALGHGLRAEITRLLVHGVLHLLGYDHERSARDASVMARKERAILRKIR